jgi:Concanavalin A-like lectin/glucanases superfamily
MADRSGARFVTRVEQRRQFGRGSLRRGVRGLLFALGLFAAIMGAGGGTAAGAQSPPSNTVPPTVSGTRHVGNTLTASPGAWSVGDPIRSTYRWQRCGYAGLVRRDAPFGYWRLGDAGTVAADEVGRSDGIYGGGVSRGFARALAGDTNRATRFDGAGGKVTIKSPLQLDSGDFTLESWFKTRRATGNRTIWIQSGAVGGTATAVFEVERGHLHFHARDTRGAVLDLGSGTTLSNGVWHHGSAVRQGNRWSLYLNGHRVASGTAKLGDVDAVDSVSRIGGSFGAGHFDGLLDEVAVYKSALGTSRIEAHHDAGRAMPCRAIPRATSSTYVLQPADVGSRVRTLVSARSAGGVATAPSTLADETVGDIVHAWAYAGDPNAGGALQGEEWARLRGRTARHESHDLISTRNTFPCDGNDPLGPQCAEVRTRTKGSDSESFTVYRGRDSDPSLQQVASIVDPREAFEGVPPDGRGPIADAVRSWQELPPVHGTRYERYGGTTEGEVTTSVFIDELTMLPLRQEIHGANGGLVQTLYWTYDQRMRTDLQVPSDLFRVPRPPNTTYEEQVTSHGNAPIGPVRDSETGATFRPFFLGTTPSVVRARARSFYCLADTAVVGQANSEPDADGAETWAYAEYVRVRSPSACVPGVGTKDAELTVVSLAKGSPMAASLREGQAETAKLIDADPKDPDHGRGGVVRVRLLGRPATAYVIPIDPWRVTAFLETDDTTLVITGLFDRSSFAAIASQLALR